MEKKYSIGEVAKITGIEGHTIRFWSSEMSHKIQPIIGKGARRYYTDSDISFFNQMKELIHNQGYTISMLKKGLPFEKSHIKTQEFPQDFAHSINTIQNKIDYLTKLYE